MDLKLTRSRPSSHLHCNDSLEALLPHFYPKQALSQTAPTHGGSRTESSNPTAGPERPKLSSDLFGSSLRGGRRTPRECHGWWLRGTGQPRPSGHLPRSPRRGSPRPSSLLLVKSGEFMAHQVLRQKIFPVWVIDKCTQKNPSQLLNRHCDFHT